MQIFKLVRIEIAERLSETLNRLFYKSTRLISAPDSRRELSSDGAAEQTGGCGRERFPFTAADLC